MIWLAWRRHRLALIVMACSFGLLSLWMTLNANGTNDPRALLSVEHQSAVIALLLYVVPCLMGVVLGAPLVAGELQDHTNRLAWTQSISRSRWLIIKWVVVGLSAFVLVALLQVVVHWWSWHSVYNLFEVGFPGDQIAPFPFGISGVVPVAHALFAFALGAALGAIIRHTGWAIVATVFGYVVGAIVMVFSIRPYHLVAPLFVPSDSSSIYFPNHSLWNLGPGFRIAPGFHSASDANTIAKACLSQSAYGAPYDPCLAAHHVQAGWFYQPANRYWELQWGEAGIYAAAAIVLFGFALWAVRRWRA